MVGLTDEKIDELYEEYSSHCEAFDVVPMTKESYRKFLEIFFNEREALK